MLISMDEVVAQVPEGYMPLWQVAQFFRVHPNTVRNWSIKRAPGDYRLTPYRVPPKHPSLAAQEKKRQYFFKVEDVDRWLIPC